MHNLAAVERLRKRDSSHIRHPSSIITFGWPQRFIISLEKKTRINLARLSLVCLPNKTKDHSPRLGYHSLRRDMLFTRSQSEAQKKRRKACYFPSLSKTRATTPPSRPASCCCCRYGPSHDREKKELAPNCCTFGTSRVASHQ